MRFAVLICLAALSCAAADPDFSGTWNLNPSKSTVRAMPQAAPLTLRVEHSGDKVECTAVTAAGDTEKCSYSLDRSETRNGTATAVAKWEGDAAMVNTIVLRPGGGQYTQMDRWMLARDGNSLRIRRHTVSLHGESESILVYDREGAEPAGAQLTARPSPVSSRVAEPAAEYVVQSGTRVPLALINSVSSKQSAPGDRIYLQTVYPVLADGRVVIPPGSFVNGTVTSVKRPGRVKGRAELYIRFDTLILPNGTLRDFRARVGTLDGRATEKLDKDEGRIQSEGNKSGDARTVGEAAAAGTSIGVMAGSVAGRPGMGAGVGAMAGAAAGLVGVLASRGPEAQMAAGSVVEMVLDRDIRYTREELDLPAMPQGQMMVPGTGPAPSVKDRQGGVPIPGRRLPY